LEAAGLVACRRVGREKHHYLNPVPLVEIHERWISSSLATRARRLPDLRRALEEKEEGDEPAALVFELEIKSTPERIWEAITSPDWTRRYFHDTAIRSDWRAGSKVVWESPGGSAACEGEVLEADPPGGLSPPGRRLGSGSRARDTAVSRGRSRSARPAACCA
jgi:hypothetical protein